jgi:glycosyltransferase involved in cell wall biosynthesis
MTRSRLDIVIPIFNEIEIIEQLHTRVVASCESTGLNYRIIYVDDGSRDGTAQWITDNAQTVPSTEPSKFSDRHLSIDEADDPSHVLTLESGSQSSVTLIELSRNFGQPAAILAGLQASDGDGVVIMDGDLQDPPELIPELVEHWNSGSQVVIAERTSREETLLRGIAFRTFHRFFRYLSDSPIPPNTGTFCLLDRVALESIRSLPESHRFFPGLRAWIGFHQSMVQFKRPPRAGGEPKQTFSRLAKYAMDAVFSFSFKPLRLLTTAGIAICMLSFLLASWFVFKRIAGWEIASIGFTTLTCAVFGLGGFQLIGMGVLGEYIGRIYDEVKARPQFLVRNQTQFSLDQRHELLPVGSSTTTEPDRQTSLSRKAG